MRSFSRLLFLSVYLSLFSTSVFANLVLSSPDPLDPAPLEQTTITFGWQHIGDEPYSNTWLQVGTLETGVGAYNIYNGSLGAMFPGASGSTEVAGIPLTGDNIYVKLWFQPSIGGTWLVMEYLFGTLAESAEPPQIDSVLGLPSPQEIAYDMQWSPNFTPATRWWVTVGSLPETASYLSSGVIPGSASSYSNFTEYFDSPFPIITFSTLWYQEAGQASWSSVTRPAHFGGDENTTELILQLVNSESAPETGLQVDGDNPQLVMLEPVTMAGIKEVWVYIGPSPSDNTFYDSGLLVPDSNGLVTLDTIADLPEDDSEFYITIWYRVDGSIGDPDKWYRQAHNYISAGS